MRIDNEKNRRRFRNVIATGVGLLILITPTISSGWGSAGHMMTASIAFSRLNPHARAKVIELLAIEIEPEIPIKSKDFVNASHWADDVKSVEAFKFLDPFHYINRPFTDDGTPLPTDLPKPENILKGLEDNVKILRTSPDKKAQAQALRLIIHFVGDIHQPLHDVTRVTQARPGGDLGGNSFVIKRLQRDGTLKNSNLHSYWDSGIDTFPVGGPPPTFIPPPLSDIPPAVAIAKKGNPPTNRKLELKQPFNFKLWSDESFALAKDVAYRIEEGTEPSADYKAKAIPVVRRRVAWGGYRLAALLNAIWP
jgi:hypothetical protein